MTSNFAAFFDDAERRGQLNVHLDEIRGNFPAMSEVATRHALMRLSRRGRVVQASKGSGHWLIVPLQHADFGAPPVEAWLDAYLSRSLKLPYYVAMLSAAELHGSSPYAVMVTQLMVPRPRRRVALGRIVLDFHVRSNIPEVPTQWAETANGRMRVSTPEMTACDLIERQAQVGGVGRLRATFEGLQPAFSMRGMRQLIEAKLPTPTLQRLGALLSENRNSKLAELVGRHLTGRPQVRLIPLEKGAAVGTEGHTDHAFKVWTPRQQERSNA